ncbi:MAG: elongation factor G-like protein EF-G2 [Actinomycetia bacterium]|nr:elongation factor G-like protein EF-G2 [Actinomycetes bacterium]
MGGVSMREPAIRNVVLVGPSGSGKSALAEALLFAAGAIRERGRDGGTLSDHTPIEQTMGRSVTLTPLSFEFADTRINLLDTPGYPDFVGELRAGLRAADAALFVVSAIDGIDAATQLLWQECEALGMPRAVAVTRVDKESADFTESVARCQRALGEELQPMYLPLLADDETVAGLIALLSGTIMDYSDDSVTQRPAEAQHLEITEDTRSALIEGIITESEDETLLDRFLTGEELDMTMLNEDLEKAVARGHFHPVLPVVLGEKLIGVTEILSVIVNGFPTPAEHALPAATTPEGRASAPLACDPTGDLCAEVIQTTSDQFAGRLSLVRVFSGTLTADAVLHVSGHFLSDRGHEDHDEDERIGAISSALGPDLVPVAAGRAGDLVCVTRLAAAETGDTLSSPDQPLLVEPWTMPDPLLPVALAANTRQDEDKLSTALHRLAAEDPTVRVERNRETRQVVLWCMGQTHADVILDRLQNRYAVSVTATPQRIPLRATLKTKASGQGRLVKQSGGHGQYAIVDIEVTPLAPGEGYRFVDQVVGGAIPRHYIAAVDKGLQQAMADGAALRFPLVDLEIAIVDGKSHSVDSSDMAFATAAGLALREAAASAGEVLLEPVDKVIIEVADEYVGAVMSDLSARRGRMSGTESLAGGLTRIQATVPAAELTRYTIDLRAVSHGSATFSRQPSGHERVPDRLVSTLLTQASDD